MKNTLLLNSGYEPLRVVSWQRAFVLVYQEKVDVLETYTETVATVSKRFELPAVIRLRRWINLRRNQPVIRFSRANIYARDDFRCQYCYHRFSEGDLTLDHVKPVVRGGKKTWDNIVTACMTCNQRKSDRTPEEMGMKLMKQPRMPHWLPGLVGSVRMKSAPELWLPYLEMGLDRLKVVL